jgi:hypothetical protein
MERGRWLGLLGFLHALGVFDCLRTWEATLSGVKFTCFTASLRFSVE